MLAKYKRLKNNKESESWQFTSNQQYFAGTCLTNRLFF